MGWYRRALLGALPILLGGHPTIQGRERDAGTLVVSVNGVGAGREEFSIREGRAGSREGFTVTSRRLSGEGGEVILLATTELGPDSQPVSAQLADPKAERRVYIQVSPRRVTVRAVTPAGESVREYRGGTPVWLADNESLAWFALMPRLGSGPLTTVWPREDRRETWEIGDRGLESQSLRHIVLGTPRGERHLWYDAAGRLMRVEDPAAGLQAIRVIH